MGIGILQLTLGFILLGCYFNILREKNASKIRNSNYWFLSWLGSLLLLGMSGSLIISGLQKIGIFL
jgi:vacuolar-type H+-ATPase subunit I/STV1